MNITFRQLRLFMALADTGSVSAAAKAMHVTQPSASMQLKEITDSVGVPLYEVVAKKVYLTDAGQELAQTARSIAQAWSSFEQTVDARKGLTRGHLRVAVVSTAKYFMPRLLGAFCRKHQDIDVALEILNRDGVVQRLRDNRDDLYIMSMPPDDLDLFDEVFMPNPIVVIAPANDPLTKHSKVALKDLATQRFILREQGSGTRMAADNTSSGTNSNRLCVLNWAAMNRSRKRLRADWVLAWCPSIPCTATSAKTVSRLLTCRVFRCHLHGTWCILQVSVCHRWPMHSGITC